MIIFELDQVRPKLLRSKIQINLVLCSPPPPVCARQFPTQID